MGGTAINHMKVRVLVTEQSGGGDAPETVVCDRTIETESHKQLTAKRAILLLARNFPELKHAGVIKTERGWRATRSVKPTEKCSFHYVWQHYYVAELP